MNNPSINSISEENLNQSAGAMIKSARINSGITIEQLSGILKVSNKKIQALEDNRWTEIGDSVFIRALGASVAKHLRIDPSSLLEKLPAVAHIPKFDEELLAGRMNRAISFEEPSKQKYLYIIIIFITLSLLMIFLPDEYLTKEKWNQIFGIDTPQQKENVTPSSELKEEVKIPTSQPNEIKDGSTPPEDLNKSSEKSAIPTQEQSQAISTPPIATSASASPTAEQSVNAEQKPSATSTSSEGLTRTPATDTLVIAATEASWIEVRDHQGQLKIQRLLNKGESFGLSGRLPYSVVIGRSDLVSVQFQGKPFDMTPFAKNNVARFELK